MKTKRPASPANEETTTIQQPSTSAGWKERIRELYVGLALAEQVLTERRGNHRLAAGAALLAGNANSPAVAELLDALRVAEGDVDTHKCAIELAEARLQEIEAADRQAAEEAARIAREVLVVDIRAAAEAVDIALATAASQLDFVAGLMQRYVGLGGHQSGTLKGSTTRAALVAGLRPYLNLEGFVGNSRGLRTLAEQLVPSAPVAEEISTETSAA